MSNLIELHINATNANDDSMLVLNSMCLPTTLEQLCLQGDATLRHDVRWQPPRLSALWALSGFYEHSHISATLVPQV